MICNNSKTMNPRSNEQKRIGTKTDCIQKTAIFFRDSNPKAKITNSTRRLCQGLLENGWKVGWIWGPLPLSIINVLRTGSGATGIKSYVAGGRRTEEGLWEYAPCTIRPYLRVLPDSWLKSMFSYTFPSLKKKLREVGLENPDVLVIASPFLVSALEVCRPSIVVYHCPVLYWKFERYPKVLAKAHQLLVERSDVIVVPSQYAKADLMNSTCMENEDKVKVISHGTEIQAPNLENDINRHGIVLVGIPQTTDMVLLRNIAALLKEFELKVVGPFNRKDRRLLEGLKNVRFYGILRHSETMRILNESRVGLICYKKYIAERTSAENIMKIYDYAAAGLPIVSVTLPGYEKNIGLLVKIAVDPHDFAKKVRQCMEEWEYLSEQSRIFAANNCWESKYKAFLEVLEEAMMSRHQ